MSDPFDSLFGEESPVTPRHAFAEQLRGRLVTELGELVDQPAEAGSTAINHGSLFYFTIPGADVDRAARFYSRLFEWELHRGDAGYHVANVYPPMGLASNDSIEPEVWIEVEDIEAAVIDVRRLGGTADEPVYYDSGWSASCRDPQGVRFNLSVPRDDYRQPARRSTEGGELFYWSLPALRPSISKAFYSELFGWEFGESGDEGGMHVENRLPDGGLGGGREGSSPELFFRVADLEQAMELVRTLGGSADYAGDGDEGRHAMCVDDQGVVFGLSQPAADY